MIRFYPGETVDKLSERVIIQYEQKQAHQDRHHELQTRRFGSVRCRYKFYPDISIRSETVSPYRTR